MPPFAFIQVDVDGLWAIRECYARPVGNTFRNDPVWEQGVPGLLGLFKSIGLPASFFLVGRDLERQSKIRVAHQIADDGHEIANHSYTHRIGLTLRTMGDILSEIERTHRRIERAGLQAPVGFRSPGYDLDARVLRAVRRAGYAYDASMLPTRLGPALRLADAWLAQRWQPSKRQFGRFSYGSAPREPYFPDPHRIRHACKSRLHRDLIEIPVTTLPPLGFPLTGSAIFALGPDKVIRALDRFRRKNLPVLLLLHGIDMVDCSRPIIFRQRKPTVGGFSLSAQEKEALIRPVLEYLHGQFNVVRARDWVAERIYSRGEKV